ncbi:glycosyltransferase [Rhodobium orientis]|nr:glycosyltransferase [Rhodobium orientis]
MSTPAPMDTTARPDGPSPDAADPSASPETADGATIPAAAQPAFRLKTYLDDVPSVPFDGDPAFWEPVASHMPRHADPWYPFSSLGDLVAGRNDPERTLSVCIVTPDLFGPVRNGGIGTAYWHLARFLVSHGHKVTILFTLGRVSEDKTFDHWVKVYRKEHDVELVALPESDPPAAAGRLSQVLERSRRTYEWLKEQSFDIVHTTEFGGKCYYALLAKHLGLAFDKTLFIVKTSSPMLWNAIGNGDRLTDPQQLIRASCERRSVELADIVVSPSRHMLRWMMRYGYNLPKERCFVEPNPMLTKVAAHPDDPPSTMAVTELVFFGRLERRKGLHIFTRAVSALGDAAKGLKITFLGKPSARFESRAFIAEESRDWPCEIDVITDYSSAEALDYLRKPGRLAIIPSLIDNAPFTVFECIYERIAMITADRGGGPEMILPEDRPHVVFEPIPSVLAALLKRAIDEGAVIARPILDNAENLEIWRRAHLAFGAPDVVERFTSHVPAATMPEAEEGAPLVTVCMAHHNRPALLRRALESLQRQTFTDFEVVVVDDGSDDPMAISELAAIEAEIARRGWRVIRQENRYLGAARNTGWRAARGRFILFMDDDNLAVPNEIETFLKAAASGADVLTCFSDIFEGGEEITLDTVEPLRRITPLGDDLSVGLFLNGFGDSNCFARREVLEELGGFTEDYGVGKDDQEFFARAVLRGFRLRLVPEPLFYYRLSPVRLRHKHFDSDSADLRVMNAYMDSMPLTLHMALRYAQGLKLENEKLHARAHRWRHRYEQTIDGRFLKIAKPIWRAARKVLGRG